MATKTLNVRFQQKYDTAANWLNSEIVMLAGEMAVEILKDITKTIHIENDTELGGFEDLINSSKEIGITAGASTPQNIINKVIEKLSY